MKQLKCYLLGKIDDSICVKKNVIDDDRRLLTFKKHNIL